MKPLTHAQLEDLKAKLQIAMEHGQLSVAAAVPFASEAERIAAGHKENETYSGNSYELRPETLLSVCTINYDDDEIQGDRDELTIYLPTDATSFISPNS